MSTISNIHSIVKFDSKTSKALEGQRLAKIGFKQTDAMTKAGKTAPESKCVSIPMLIADDIKPDHYILLMPHILNMLEDAQDGIVREMVEAGKNSVADASLTVQACCGFLAQMNASRRLTKEMITGWTESSGLADALRVRFAELLGVSDEPTPEDEARVEQQVKGYKEKFGMLAGTKTYFEQPVAQNLLKALALLDEDTISSDYLAPSFVARLTEMVQNPKMVDMLGL